MELRGKKLLLMSGSRDACEIVRVAKGLGIEVLATDYYKTSPVKEIADKSFMVSTSDVEAISQLCKDEKIDGIFSGYTDSVLPYMEQVSRRLHMPFWGCADNIAMCIDKRKFKEACSKANVPVVPWILLTEDDYKEKITAIDLPVVVKPVDNSGSRGVFKCYTREEVDFYIQKAFEFSAKKELLLEQLMPVGNEFSVYYLIHKGEARLFSMGDRYVDVVDDNTAPQAKGMLFPSSRLDLFVREVDEKIKLFFRQNQMNEGFVFLQGFTDDRSRFFINEIGYRLNGGFTYLFNEYFNRFHLMEELLSFTLTGEINGKELGKITPRFKGVGLLLTISLKEGRIAKVEGLDEISNCPGVLRIIQQHFVGDELCQHGTSAQIFGYIHCVAKDKGKLLDTVRYIESQLKIEDENQKSLLLGILNKF